MNVSLDTHVAILAAAETANIDVRFVARGQIELLTDVSEWFGGQFVTLPKGFVSDGASVPPFFYAIVGHPYAGSSLRAALLHDWFTQHRLFNSNDVSTWFFQRLRRDGVAWARAYAMYVAVRYFADRWNTPSPAAPELGT